MRFVMLASMMALLGMTAAGARNAVADERPRISGPHVHENLAIYLVHGPSTDGPVPLTLQEALAKGTVQVIETRQVNELRIENTGSEEVFIQAGDIVKGGAQDRVLTVSLLLKPKSGQVPISAFCVEQGRWAARGSEDVKRFASASEMLPSREAKLAMRAPVKPNVAPETGVTGPLPAARSSGTDPARTEQRDATAALADTGAKQRKVWDEVARIQSVLAASIGHSVAAPQSATSLQLALENERLQAARRMYKDALSPILAGAPEATGYVVAINGRIVSADIYPSAALLRKMWDKSLNAAITEAIGAKANGSAAAAAETSAVQAFLAEAAAAKAERQKLAADMTQELRDSEAALYVEAQSAGGRWVHRSVLAKR